MATKLGPLAKLDLSSLKLKLVVDMLAVDTKDGG
jgi:hypothetical protein